MDRVDWEIYALLRQHNRQAAETFRRSRRAEKKLTRPAPGDLDWKIVPDCCADPFESRLEKAFIPQHLTQVEWDALADRVWLSSRGAFGCTGRPFSFRLKRFKVPGGTWIYHWIAYDV